MHLNISPSSAHLAEVRRAARLVLRALPADIAHDLLLALDEAVSNAVKHGSAGGGLVEVSIEYSEGWVELRVLDRGPTPAVPALPEDPPSPMALGGRGLWLISQLSDEVRVEAAGLGTLLKIRRRTGATDAWPFRSGGYRVMRDLGRRDSQRDRIRDGDRAFERRGWHPWRGTDRGREDHGEGGRDGHDRRESLDRRSVRSPNPTVVDRAAG
jgi:anti-sigma regulatory factor (Ser/Thr protein kinase)